jgi:hypothetical protein
VRDLCRRLPRGYRAFRRIERFYGTAPNNAVLGAEARNPFVEELVGRMQTLPKTERRARYALGVHLLQRAVTDWSGTGLYVERPERFYPLGPEISEQWFRRYDAVDANEVVSTETLLVHLYASVRVKESLERLDPGWVRAHEKTELFSNLAAPILDELGW